MKENDFYKYVIVDGKFIGKFEEMYQNCDDPWLQDSLLYQSNKIVIDILKRDNYQYENVLDIGCGKGNYTNLLYEILKCNIDAIDISKTAIQVAQNRYDNINFIADDFLRTNQIKMNYDLIIVSQVLWYVLENLDSFFQKMKNVASDKAKIIFIQTYYHPDKQEYGNNVMTKVDDIIDILPFQLENIIDVKNYKDGLWVETRSIIICNN